MAQHFWTAEDYALDANTTDAWEERFSITSQLVKSDADGKYMEVVHPNKASGGMEFLPPATFSDGEVLALLKSPATGFDNAVIIRADFFSGTFNRNFYAFDILDSNLRITKYVSGSRTVIQEVSNSVSLTSQFWVRVEASGTTIRGRIWADGSSEPATWDVSVTDSAISGPGFAGLAVYDKTVQAYQYSIGTGGDPAPSSASSTPTITSVDGDNAVTQYQQNITAATSDLAESVTSATFGGEVLTVPDNDPSDDVITFNAPGNLASGTYDLVLNTASETLTFADVSYTQTHARPAFDGLVDSNSILSGQSYTANTYFRFVTNFSNGTLDTAAGDAAEWAGDIADYYTPDSGFTGDDTASIEFLYSDGTTSATVGVTVTVSEDGSVTITARGRRGFLRPCSGGISRSIVEGIAS